MLHGSIILMKELIITVTCHKTPNVNMKGVFKTTEKL